MSKQQRSSEFRTARLVRRAAAATAAITVAAGLSVVGASGAQAGTSFTVRLSPHLVLNPGLVLDVSGASHAPYAGVIDYVPNNGANQLWTFVSFSGNDYEIINVNSNECLTTDGVPGHQVYQLPCNGQSGQHWVTNLTAGDHSTPRLIQNPGSSLCLDVYGGSSWGGAVIDAWWWNGADNQFFYGESY
jgi:hypothetical protein